MDILARQLEVLPPCTVIERLTGDGDKRRLIAPLWSRDKIKTLSLLDKTLVKKDTYQGKAFKEKAPM